MDPLQYRIKAGTLFSARGPLCAAGVYAQRGQPAHGRRHLWILAMGQNTRSVVSSVILIHTDCRAWGGRGTWKLQHASEAGDAEA